MCLQLLAGLDSHRLMLSAAKSKNKHRFCGYLRDGTLTQVVILVTDTFIAQNDLYILTTYTGLITTNSCVVSAERDRSESSRQGRVPSSGM
jgi:hypothetical protein